MRPTTPARRMAPNPAGPPPKTEAVAQVGSCADRPGGGGEGRGPSDGAALGIRLPSIKSATGTFRMRSRIGSPPALTGADFAGFPRRAIGPLSGRRNFCGLPSLRLTHRPPGPPPSFLVKSLQITPFWLRRAVLLVTSGAGPAISPGEGSAGGATQRSCHVAGAHLPFLMLAFGPLPPPRKERP